MKRKIKKFQHLFQGNIIDIGAGNAPYKKLFKQYKQYQTTNTKRHYKEEEINEVEKFTDIWIEDGSKLPVKHEAFDCAVCFQVMSVINNPEAFFNEINRVLKPKGVFMLTTDFLYPKWSREDVLRHTDGNLKELCHKTGFEVLELESFGGFWTMLHCNINRYFRSYPGKIKESTNSLSYFFRTLFFFFILIMLPFFQIFGWIIYILEKNKNTDFEYTVNNMLIARKS